MADLHVHLRDGRTLEAWLSPTSGDAYEVSVDGLPGPATWRPSRAEALAWLWDGCPDDEGHPRYVVAALTWVGDSTPTKRAP